jgi:hypothetical protein
MEKSNARNLQPACMLAHDLINRLAVIVGHCDLLTEDNPADSKCRKRLALIREIAYTAATELGEHQCHLDNLARSAVIDSENRLRGVNHKAGGR